jgi:hypothetical protein
MPENILMEVKQASPSTSLLKRAVASVDPGPGARLVVRAAQGRRWVVYRDRTDVGSCGNLARQLTSEIRRAIEEASS